MDVTHVANILFKNRDSKDYLTDSGKLRILAENGVKLARRTYDSNKKAILKEVKSQIDLEITSNGSQPTNKELEKIIGKMDYVLLLKRIMDGEPDGKRTPAYKDKLQAGKQAAEFFGWNEATKVTQTDLEGKNISIQGTQVIFKVELNNSI